MIPDTHRNFAHLPAHNAAERYFPHCNPDPAHTSADM